MRTLKKSEIKRVRGGTGGGEGKCGLLVALNKVDSSTAYLKLRKNLGKVGCH